MLHKVIEMNDCVTWEHPLQNSINLQFLYTTVLHIDFTKNYFWQISRSKVCFYVVCATCLPPYRLRHAFACIFPIKSPNSYPPTGWNTKIECL